jgi:rhodanese-related sulfurtransferase
MSIVRQFPAASNEIAKAHFAARLSLETDCSDVESVLGTDDQDFVLLHVISRPEIFAKRHIKGAHHLPHRLISEETLAQFPKDTLFVVYCAGPHCNGADKAAFKLASLGRPVKLMLGGLQGWEDEGFALEGDGAVEATG